MSSHQGLSFPQDGDRVSLGPFGLLRSHIFAVSPRLFSIWLVFTGVVFTSCKFECVFPNAGKCNRHTKSWEKRFISFLFKYFYDVKSKKKILCLKRRNVLQRNASRYWRELALLLGCSCEDTKRLRQRASQERKRPDSIGEVLAQDVHFTDWWWAPPALLFTWASHNKRLGKCKSSREIWHEDWF